MANHPKKNIIVRIAGAAGDGIASSGELFGRICARQGLHVLAYNSYQSAIRGGHVWLQFNVGSDKTLTHGDEPDVAILLNRTSPELHLPQMKKGGVVLYNSTIITEDLTKIRQDLTYYGLPFKELVTEAGVIAVMANTMLIGSLVQLLGLDLLGLFFKFKFFSPQHDGVHFKVLRRKGIIHFENFGQLSG